MELTPWTVNAWRTQRRATWAAIRLWLILLLAGVIGFYIPFWLNREHVHKLPQSHQYILSTNDESEAQFTLGLVSFVVAGGALIAIIFAVRRHYRCPKCGEMPMARSGLRWSLAIFPAACPNCGARLR
jgi:hypothetical protein